MRLLTDVAIRHGSIAPIGCFIDRATSPPSNSGLFLRLYKMNKLQTNAQIDHFIKLQLSYPKSYQNKMSNLPEILDNTFAEDCMEAQELYKYLCMDIDTAH